MNINNYKNFKNPNKIKFKINLITNFKPYNIKYLNLNKIKKKKYCKNFFFFLILLKYINKVFFNMNSKFFISNNKKKSLTILRPPYRHKLSRHQIQLTRYFISFFFSVKNKNEIKVNNINNIYIFIYFLFNFCKWFESNIAYQNYNICNFLFFFSDNFKLSNYK